MTNIMSNIMYGHELCELFYELYSVLDLSSETSADELLNEIKSKLNENENFTLIKQVTEGVVRKSFGLIEGGSLLKAKAVLLLIICIVCPDLDDCPVPLIDGEMDQIALSFSLERMQKGV
ncbi:hypothetical protein E4J66_03850 [Actinomyces viscosus]|uniref:hypothetical protein n=1 Tax=Actinomyces viscosus TaxID=1656 RepID=UPI000F83A228|nr:hypothetical protein [Actinomyces viscosus]TFH53429.1 hypothetical protein E4J66_03850 [Actinomyces viscosus]